MEGNLRFKIDWASLEVERKFTDFALFYFAFECKSTSPRGAYIWRDYLTEGFLRHGFGGFIFGGAYTWRGLFSEFFGIPSRSICQMLANFSAVEFKRTVSKFRKRKRKLLSYVHVGVLLQT